MEKRQPSFLDLLLETHIGLERQGPGSADAVRQALDLLGARDCVENIADLGCGTGGQTMLLAEYLPGTVTGLDMFPCFIEKLNRTAEIRGLEHRVKGIVGKMEELPFEKGSLDLIWSEGAIDNIGFEEGLSHWRDFLKCGGFVAVSSPSWLTKEHPTAVEQFWSDAGSHLDSVETNIRVLQDCGYAFVGAFVLPETCWTENYYAPRERTIRSLMEKYGGCDTVRQYAELNRREVELYLSHKQHYGYVFYIGRAV